MTRRLLLSTLLFSALAGAAGFEFTGRFDEAWDRHEFEFTATGGSARLWLTLPAHSGARVTAVRDTVTVYDVHLVASSPVSLRGSGRYKVTVQRDSGAGAWSVKDIGGTGTLLALSGFADTLFSPRITFTTDEDEANWQFTWPRSDIFVVQRLGPSGKPVEEQDLYDEDVFQFIGPGSATLVVKVTDGGGAYTAKLAR